MTNYKSITTKAHADLYTPVSLFYKLRESYPEVLLLESSDYSSKEDSYSFLVCDALAGIEVKNGLAKTFKRGVASTKFEIKNFVTEFQDYMASFTVDGDEISKKYNGLFGYTGFEGCKYFDKDLYIKDKPSYDLPEIKYGFYRFILVIDHVSDDLYIVENIPNGESSMLVDLQKVLDRPVNSKYNFSLEGSVTTNQTDEAFKSAVTKCKSHCQRGDVFQIVPSRRYEQGYKGDEFNVYRKLRSINPSPYLFFFDYGSFKIFGSSPEAQMIVKNGVAEIHPIAGTVKRTGDLEMDAKSAQELLVNPKENAEHIMLVDLARNDLSKNTKGVYVSKYRELQRFSHVYHLVSIVKGQLKPGVSSYQIFADTFPAGTLSGAPKYMAIQLIDELEPTKRGYYGGGLGVINFNGNLNHAIMIRSFLAHEHKLYFQAGAGVVIDSTEEGELQEVNNKLAALNKALIEATSF
ncbi:MAG: anthranilate synthase component I family protein [Saprospiraceae bacterium]|nr:anthranilate synthase component I family protein [Saprospiraceae bacterium]